MSLLKVNKIYGQHFQQPSTSSTKEALARPEDTAIGSAMHGHELEMQASHHLAAETFEDSIKDSGAHEAMKYDTVHLTSEGYDQKSLQEMQECNRHQRCCPSTPSSPGLLLLGVILLVPFVISIAAILGSSWLVDDYGYAGVELLNEKAMRVMVPTFTFLSIFAFVLAGWVQVGQYAFGLFGICTLFVSWAMAACVVGMMASLTGVRSSTESRLFFARLFNLDHNSDPDIGSTLIIAGSGAVIAFLDWCAAIFIWFKLPRSSQNVLHEVI